MFVRLRSLVIRLAPVVVVAAMLPVLSAQVQRPADASVELKLPPTGTVYVKDSDGTLVEIHGHEVSYDPHAAGNFMRGMVYAGPQSSIELDGPSAALTLDTTQPVFYVRLDSDDQDIAQRGITLLELEPNKTVRTVVTFTANIFGGHRRRFSKDVPVIKSNAGEDGVLQLTPQQPLEPGQYAIAFLPKSQIAGPDIVYDFAIPGTPQPKARKMASDNPYD